MEKYTYNFEISNLLAQFLDAFNEIVVKRFDRAASYSSPTPTKSIDVKVVYAPKKRVVNDVINNQGSMTLPVIAVTIGNIERDVERVFNKIEGPSFPHSENVAYHDLTQPLPVNVGINMHILAKHTEDLHQIVSNFAPYCDPYVVVSWKDPYLPNQEIRSQIFWDGTIATEYPEDMDHTKYFNVIGETSFTIKGWLFKAQTSDAGVIHNIYTHFHAVSDIYCEYAANAANEGVTDTEVISGRPTITNVAPFEVYSCYADPIIITGTMFDFATAFFLSGSVFDSPTAFDVSNTPISSEITTISGIRIFPTIANDHIASFVMPVTANSGYFDIIAINNAGVGRLTQDSVRTVTYPSPSASAGEEGWEISQPPCISGVEVLSTLQYC